TAVSDVVCDLSDLPPAWCAHCQGHVLDPEYLTTYRESCDAAVESALDRPRPWMTSEWPGVCMSCRDTFTHGTMVRMHLDGGWQAQCCRHLSSGGCSGLQTGGEAGFPRSGSGTAGSPR